MYNILRNNIRRNKMKKALLLIICAALCALNTACARNNIENNAQTAATSQELSEESTTENQTTEETVVSQTENPNLCEFSYVRNDNWFVAEENPDFLDENQIETFKTAQALIADDRYCNCFGYYPSEMSDSVGVDWNGYNITYYLTGASFASFEEYINSVLTQEAADNILKSATVYNYNGELCVTPDFAGKGGGIGYMGCSYELISSTDDTIEFNVIAHYSYEEVMSEEEYNDLPDDEKAWDTVNSVVMKNTDGTWRVSKLEYWI